MEIQWQGTTDINAPVDRVYAYLADFPKHCEWAQTLERMELRKPGDNRGVGAVYRTYERQAMHADRPPRGPMPAKAFKGTTECEVTELEPNQRIAWRAHPVPITMGTSAQLAFDLEPLDAERTRLTQTIRMRQSWLPSQIFARLVFKMDLAAMERKGAAQWQASLNNIKAILEEHQTGTP